MEEVTVAAALREYLQSARAYLARSTSAEYQNSVEGRLIPAFGELPLSGLTRAAIRSWVATQSCSGKRIRNILAPLRGVLADAQADGVIERNPLHGWTPRVRDRIRTRSTVDPFSLEEMHAILDASSEPGIRHLFQFAFWTGLRSSELLALQWRDWTPAGIHVTRAKVMGELKCPKTAAGRRVVHLLAPAREALKAQRSLTQLRGEYVFLNPYGKPWVRTNQVLQLAWKPALKRAGVRYRRAYNTRHTYASLMLSAGENPAWVAQQMGHTDIGLVLRVYGRWIPSTDPDAGRRAEALWR